MSIKNTFQLNSIYLINRKKEWFQKLGDYITLRFNSITSRLIQTFRFVELHPNNKDAFSYEYASLLRDIGSVFSSVMDGLLKGTQDDGRYNIDDYRTYLLENISDLEKVYVELGIYNEQRFLYPFNGFSGKTHSSQWWKAFINVKHFDYKCMNEGCLSNVIYAYGALAITREFMNEFPPTRIANDSEQYNTPIITIWFDEINNELCFQKALNPQES